MHLELKSFAPAAPAPYPMSSGQPAHVVDGDFGVAGQRVGWLERPGVVVEVSITDELVGQLDEIVDSIALREPGEAVDEAVTAACPAPEVRPTALPWLAEGEPFEVLGHPAEEVGRRSGQLGGQRELAGAAR